MEDWADTAPAWQLPLPPPSPVYLHRLPSLLPLSFLITSSPCIIPPSTSCETYDDAGVGALTPEGASSDGYSAGKLVLPSAAAPLPRRTTTFQ